MMRSGRMRSELRTSSRIGICALALDVRRARLEPQHVALLQLELGGILDRDDPLGSSGMAEESAFSSVVLPEPVPPEMMMLSSALDAAAGGTRPSPGDSVPRFDHVVERRAACCENLRIVISGPD